jgi:hypothetical protein
MQNKIHNILKYFLIFLLVACYGIPFFRGDINFIILFVCSFITFIYFKKETTKFIYFYLGAFFLILLLQVLSFGFLKIDTLLGQLTRIYIAYLVLKVCENNFIDRFINILLLLIILSTPFYIISLINNDFPPILINFARQIVEPLEFDKEPYFTPHFIIFTIRELYRNSGPFWEPGGYALILNFGIILSSIKEKKLINKKSVYLIIALLTTLSTGGIISFFLYSIIYYSHSKSPYYIIFGIPLLVYIFYLSYNTYDFLGEKIKTQVFEVDYANQSSNTRSVSAYKDWQTIKESPILGKGIFTPLKEKWSNTNNEYRNNGTSNFLAVWGISGFLIFFTVSFFSFSKFCKNYNYPLTMPLGIVITLLVLNSSEMVLGISPFSWCFSFMFFVINPNKIK